MIFANSSVVADDVARREGVPRETIRVIRNGVLIPDVMPEPERAAVRAGWGVGPSDLLVGYVGSMRPGKGHERIVGAMPALLDRVPEARLVLVGGGPCRPAIEQQITLSRAGLASHADG